MALGDLLKPIRIMQTITFCDTSTNVDFLADKLRDLGFTVTAIHDEIEQSQRDTDMNEFHSGSSRIMITTDDFSCGSIDVQHVSLVINYNFPTCITRTTSIVSVIVVVSVVRVFIVINLVTVKEMPSLRAIEQFYSTQIDKFPGDIKSVI